MFGNKIQQYKQKQKGFSLIELMVTIAIISIVLAISLAKYGTFNNVVLLKNQAFALALDIRKAQTYASSVRNESSIAGNDGNASSLREEVGVYLTTAGAGRSQYILFVDKGNSTNVVYQAGEAIATIKLDDRFEIANICVPTSTSCANIGRVDITFKRPDFDATILRSGPTSRVESVRITLRSKQNTSFTRSVLVTSTGQISVE